MKRSAGVIAGEAAGKTAAIPRAPMVKQKTMNVPLKVSAPSMAVADDGGPDGKVMLLDFQIALPLDPFLQALINFRQDCEEKKSISPSMPAPKFRSANGDQSSVSSSDWHTASSSCGPSELQSSEWSVLPQICSPLPPIPPPPLGDGHGSHKGNKEDRLQVEPSSDWATMIEPDLCRAAGELSSFSSSNKKWVIHDSADEETLMRCHIRKLSSRPIQEKKPTPELDVPAYEALCRNAKEAHQKALEEALIRTAYEALSRNAKEAHQKALEEALIIRNIQEANALADAKEAQVKAEEAKADKAQAKAQEVQVENTQRSNAKRGERAKWIQKVVATAQQENMKASAKVTKKKEEERKEKQEEEHDGKECKQA